MTHPMTPREKVAELIWERFAPSSDMDRENALRGEYAIAADDILTTLASGSGDHAELERKLRARAESIVETPLGPFRSSKGRLRNPDGPSAADALKALIAENAVLRGERDAWRKALSDAQNADAKNDAILRTRALEAERKLAEARGLLEPFSEAAENLDDDTRDHDHIWEQAAAMTIDAGHLRAARTFLSSTEAERG